MSYRLYNRLGSGGFAIEVALTLAGARFELELLDSVPGNPLPESFREINPWGQVPALILPDGSLMTESAAMLIHIAAAHPDKGLAPTSGTPAHARFLRWLVFLAANVYEAEIRIGYPDRFTTDPAGAPAISEAAHRRMTEGLALVAAEVTPGGYLFGAEMGVIDVYIAMLVAWHGDGGMVGEGAALAHRVAAHPVVAPIWQRNFDSRMDVKWGRR